MRKPDKFKDGDGSNLRQVTPEEAEAIKSHTRALLAERRARRELEAAEDKNAKEGNPDEH